MLCLFPFCCLSKSFNFLISLILYKILICIFQGHNLSIIVKCLFLTQKKGRNKEGTLIKHSTINGAFCGLVPMIGLATKIIILWLKIDSLTFQ